MTESDTWLDVLGANWGATLRAAWGGEPWMGSTGGMPVNGRGIAPIETVIFNRGYSTTGPGIDNTRTPSRTAHSSKACRMPAWDRHLLVFQEGTCISQELYNVPMVLNCRRIPSWTASKRGLRRALRIRLDREAGVHVDMSSPLYPVIGHANASRLPYLPMILRPDELGEWPHRSHAGHRHREGPRNRIRLAARSGDGDGSNPDGVPMGTVFRLSADFDISGYAPATQVVLRALQQHGAVVYDSMGTRHRRRRACWR